VSRHCGDRVLYASLERRARKVIKPRASLSLYVPKEKRKTYNIRVRLLVCHLESYTTEATSDYNIEKIPKDRANSSFLENVAFITHGLSIQNALV
jgi:hypothetical protein